ncbi:Hypothetical predicted protein, partial [Paramuricea clavata]
MAEAVSNRTNLKETELWIDSDHNDVNRVGDCDAIREEKLKKEEAGGKTSFTCLDFFYAIEKLYMPFHRLILGIGWKRSGTRCSVPQQLSGQNKRKLPNGDRGISKLLSRQVWKHTGILIPVGSGLCRSCREKRQAFTEVQDKEKYSTKKEGAEGQYESEEIGSLIDGMSNLSFDGKLQTLEVQEDEEKLLTTKVERRSPNAERECLLTHMYFFVKDGNMKATEPSETSTPAAEQPFYFFEADELIESLSCPLDISDDSISDVHEEESDKSHLNRFLKTPKNSDELWNSLVKSKWTSSNDLEYADNALLECLVQCYNEADQWDTPRQILSIMAEKLRYNTICMWIPDLTRYRYKIAKRHSQIHGIGVPVPRPCQTRMRVPQDLPFGEKKLTQSTKKRITVPNIIRSIVAERIVKQYQ